MGSDKKEKSDRKEKKESKGEMQSENLTENIKLKKILELQKTVLTKIINTANNIKPEPGAGENEPKLKKRNRK